jgi:hypothetical protein
MKRSLCFLWGVMLLNCAEAQRLSPTIISTAGDFSRSGNLSIEWTLGEFAIETLRSGQRLYTQGFHQPQTGIMTFPAIAHIIPADKYKVTLAPNPVINILTVHLQLDNTERLEFSLYDAAGKHLLSKNASGKLFSIPIETHQLTAGFYLLTIKNSKGIVVRSFKVLKLESNQLF